MHEWLLKFMRSPKLAWDAIGFKRKTNQILLLLEEILSNIPEEYTGKRKTPSNFYIEFKSIIETIEKIENELIPNLESSIHVKFKTHELFYLALAQPNLNSLYKNVGRYFESININSSLTTDDFNLLAASGETSKVLALLGDAVLDLAVVETHWETSVDRVGDLSKKREKIVKNSNLARICDEWNLYKYRLKKIKVMDKSRKEEIVHLKGTLVEAIIGIIYMENEPEVLLQVLPYLQ